MNLREWKTKTKGMTVAEKENLFYSLSEENQDKLRKARKNQKRKQEKEAILKSLGLTKVKGVISGKTYWE